MELFLYRPLQMASSSEVSTLKKKTSSAWRKSSGARRHNSLFDNEMQSKHASVLDGMLSSVDGGGGGSGNRLGSLSDMTQRITCLKRSGQLVWVGKASGEIAVYDITKSIANPLAEVQPSACAGLKGATPRSLLVEFGMILYRVQQNKAKIDQDCNNNNEKPPSLMRILQWQPFL